VRWHREEGPARLIMGHASMQVKQRSMGLGWGKVGANGADGASGARFKGERLADFRVGLGLFAAHLSLATQHLQQPVGCHGTSSCSCSCSGRTHQLVMISLRGMEPLRGSGSCGRSSRALATVSCGGDEGCVEAKCGGLNFVLYIEFSVVAFALGSTWQGGNWQGGGVLHWATGSSTPVAVGRAAPHTAALHCCGCIPSVVVETRVQGFLGFRQPDLHEPRLRPGFTRLAGGNPLCQSLTAILGPLGQLISSVVTGRALSRLAHLAPVLPAFAYGPSRYRHGGVRPLWHPRIGAAWRATSPATSSSSIGGPAKSAPAPSPVAAAHPTAHSRRAAPASTPSPAREIAQPAELTRFSV
jgi:hypothetical protein